jgi:hypothetical protein
MRGQWKREFREFSGLVWAHWKINLTGGTLLALLFLYQISGKSTPWWAYAGIAVLTLFVSCFLTWRAEHLACAGLKSELVSEKTVAEMRLAEERNRREAAERALVDERTHKQSLEEAVLREAKIGFRTLNKSNAGAVTPRFFLNSTWVEQVAKKYGFTAKEVDEQIDRSDGKFHWQI